VKQLGEMAADPFATRQTPFLAHAKIVGKVSKRIEVNLRMGSLEHSQEVQLERSLKGLSNIITIE
jgi:hypothetical protein